MLWPGSQEAAKAFLRLPANRGAAAFLGGNNAGNPAPSPPHAQQAHADARAALRARTPPLLLRRLEMADCSAQRCACTAGSRITHIPDGDIIQFAGYDKRQYRNGLPCDPRTASRPQRPAAQELLRVRVRRQRRRDRGGNSRASAAGGPPCPPSGSTPARIALDGLRPIRKRTLRIPDRRHSARPVGLACARRERVCARV